MYSVIYKMDTYMTKEFKELEQALKFAEYKIDNGTFIKIKSSKTLKQYKGKSSYNLNIWYNEESAKVADMLANNTPKGTGKKET